MTPYDDRLVQVIALLAAAGAAVAPGAPTGTRAVDVVYQAALGGLVTLAGARARRWTLLLLGAVATIVGHGWTAIVGPASLLIAFASAASTARVRLLGALAAGLAIQVLLRQQFYAFHGASVLVGALAVGPVLVSAHRRCRSQVRRRNLQVAGVVLGLAIVLSVVFGLAALLAAGHLRAGADEARDSLQAARRGDAATAQGRLQAAESSFSSARRFTGAAWARTAQLVPWVAQHAAAARVATEQGRSVARAGSSVAQVGDYRDLKYRSGRIDLSRIAALSEPLGRASLVLDGASARLHNLDRSWLLGPVTDRLDRLIDEIDHASGDARLANQALQEAPGLLGGRGTRTYFVAFVNPAEERGGGGFLGNYGILTARNGQLKLTRSGPISELITARKPGERTLNGPRDYLARYQRFDPPDFFQDVTFSPHFPYTADVIAQLYPQSGGRRLDGVMSIDPYGLAALLNLTGPIRVPGLDQPLTAENAADTLLRQQYLTFSDADNSLRKDLLVEASRLTFKKLTSGSLPSPERLAELLGPMVRERRLMLAATRPSEERFFRNLRADGALPKVGRGDDLLMVSHQNFGNNKLDAYLHRSIGYSASVDLASGAVDATATITMRNDAPASGLPRIVIGNNRKVPTGTNLMYLTIYSPFGLKDASTDGRPLSLTREKEAGLQAYTGLVAVPPRATVRVRVRLRGHLDLSQHRYGLTMVPQSMVNPDVTSARVRASHGRITRSSGARIEASTAAAPRRATAEPRVVTLQLDR